jgi:histidyl-tRNA synthetase
MTTLPGFRDFYPADCAQRNYILSTWREVARRYGFVEYDGPVLEPMGLYEKKSGGELVGQLFDFVDKGERHVAMRPEMTPTLARMVAARERDFKKPLKWFCCPQFFRYEKQQRGRLREFYQFNADIIGEPTLAADAEIIALAIDVLRSFGFTQSDFVVRVSSRFVWIRGFLERLFGLVPHLEILTEFFQILDKLEREPAEVLNERLKPFKTSLGEIQEFIERTKTQFLSGEIDSAGSDSSLNALYELRCNLEARGLADCIELDLTIVRGLAYYTGIVFEVFDRAKHERALAGGGRYDALLTLMSDHKVNMSALGFGMGDVVLANLIADTPAAKAKMDAWISQKHAADIYVVIAKEERRAEALGIVQQLRDAGLRVDFPLTAAKVGKQFQAAEQLGAKHAVLVGDEWPQVKLKTLATREEVLASVDEAVARLAG